MRVILLVAAALLLTSCLEGREDGRPAAPQALHPDCLSGLTTSQTLTFARGDNLDTLLERAGIAAVARQALARQIAEVFDLGRFRAGREIRLLRDEDGHLIALHYAIDYEHDLCAWQGRDRLRAEIYKAELAWRYRTLEAVLHGSFYEAFEAIGEDGGLATRIADLFSGEVDFFLEPREGDRMHVLLAETRRADRPKSRNRVHAVRLSIGGREIEAFHFPDTDGRDRYYQRDGASLQRRFLRAPLSYTRVSSGFSHSRYHPILKRRRPHHGVDYAAPAGTPVVATAAGTVTVKKRDSQAGRWVAIRHPGGVETRYLHLSRWARGLRTGKRVEQGQVIGYVGSSGLSTGPHLDYRIRVGGRPVDPRRWWAGPADPLPTNREASFRQRVARLDSIWTERDSQSPRPLASPQTSK